MRGKFRLDVSASFESHGLILRGGFNFDREEDAPSGRPAASLLMIGNAGAAHWPHFCAWRSTQAEGPADPLDRWTREVVEPVAARLGVRAVFPFEKPFHPFQRWAMRAEGLKPSPLGILMHPEYGLWHAYRAALLLDEELPVAAPRRPVHLCDACAGKPCVNACPAGAYSANSFAYAQCVSHLRAPDGDACRTGGCLARNACPAGEAFRYPAEAQAFHQSAFLGG